MFSKFFYTLKDKGLDVSLSEWLTLQDALNQGLCNSSLTEFYYVARMILVKSETEFDKFDMSVGMPPICRALIQSISSDVLGFLRISFMERIQ